MNTLRPQPEPESLLSKKEVRCACQDDNTRSMKALNRKIQDKERFWLLLTVFCKAPRGDKMKREKNMPLLRGPFCFKLQSKGTNSVKRGNRIKRGEWYPGQEIRLQGRVGKRILTPRTPSNMVIQDVTAKYPLGKGQINDYFHPTTFFPTALREKLRR